MSPVSPSSQARSPSVSDESSSWDESGVPQNPSHPAAASSSRLVASNHPQSTSTSRSPSPNPSSRPNRRVKGYTAISNGNEAHTVDSDLSYLASSTANHNYNESDSDNDNDYHDDLYTRSLGAAFADNSPSSSAAPTPTPGTNNHNIDDDDIPLTNSSRAAGKRVVFREEPLPYEQAIRTTNAGQGEPSSSSSSTATANDSTTSYVVDATDVPYAATGPNHDFGEGATTIFSLEGKPEVTADTNGKIYEDIEPPSYADVAADTAPSYYDTTIVTTGFAEDGEILVEGMPVGDFFTFFINMVVSMTFDFVGFLLTTLLATSHAARCGSKAGLGITLIRYGFYLRAKSYENSLLDDIPEMDGDGSEIDGPLPPNEQPGDGRNFLAQTDFISFLLMFCGFSMLMLSNTKFIRAKRMEIAIAATVSQSAV